MSEEIEHWRKLSDLRGKYSWWSRPQKERRHIHGKYVPERGTLSIRVAFQQGGSVHLGEHPIVGFPSDVLITKLELIK